MVVRLDEDKCNECGACVDVCPTSAITKDDGEKPKIDEDLCSDCAACIDECPNDALALE